MSNIVQTPSASLNSTPRFKLGERMLLPCTVTREEAKELARKLWADDSNAFAGASTCATNDSLACKVIALALSKLVFGEHSRLERAERYAATLPEYRKSKAGVIAGAIGKRIGILREAVSIGEALRDKILNVGSIAEFNLVEIFGQSPVLGGMLAPPAPAKKTTEDATVTAARKESAEKAEAEKRATEIAAKQMTVKISEQQWQEGIAMLCGALDNNTIENITEDKSQAARLDLARAHRMATEKATSEARYAAQLRREGESKVAKIHAFCDLATELGVKLTPAQLRVLDALEFGEKAA